MNPNGPKKHRIPSKTGRLNGFSAWYRIKIVEEDFTGKLLTSKIPTGIFSTDKIP
jgi:hypothetical protein